MRTHDDLESLQHRKIGDHSLSVGPTERLSGWIVTCVCGWSNELAPARSSEEASKQLAHHQRRD